MIGAENVSGIEDVDHIDERVRYLRPEEEAPQVRPWLGDPEFGDEATVHYIGTSVDGTKLESTRDREEPLTVKVGEGEVAKGLERGIFTMKKGEIALFTLTPAVGGRLMLLFSLKLNSFRGLQW